MFRSLNSQNSENAGKFLTASFQMKSNESLETADLVKAGLGSQLSTLALGHGRQRSIDFNTKPSINTGLLIESVVSGKPAIDIKTRYAKLVKKPKSKKRKLLIATNKENSLKKPHHQLIQYVNAQRKLSKYVDNSGSLYEDFI